MNAASEMSPSARSAAFRAWRRRHKLSLTRAAEAIGMSRRMVAYYEKGEKPVPQSVLLACQGWEAARPQGASFGRDRNADGHLVAELARVLSHKLYAEAILRDPGLIPAAAKVVDRLQATGQATLADRMWQRLLSLGADRVIPAMLDEGETGRLLRSNSPFSRLIGVEDANVRKALWQIASFEALTRSTSGALS